MTETTLEREPARAKEPAKRWRNVYWSDRGWAPCPRCNIPDQQHRPGKHIWFSCKSHPSKEIAEQKAATPTPWQRYLGPEEAP